MVTVKRPCMHLGSAEHAAHELGHCLGLDDAYTEFGDEDDPAFGIRRREFGKAYNLETDNCQLMDEEETKCHENDLEMMLKAYRDAIADEGKGSFQSFTDYTCKDEEGGTWRYVRSGAIATPKGR